MTALPLRTALPEAEKFSDRDSHPFRVTPDLSDPRMLRGRRSGRQGAADSEADQDRPWHR